jgi:cytochrome c oxidase subunit 3
MTVFDSHGGQAADRSPEKGGGHDHPPHLAHHWESSRQQFEAGKLGMWLFLATELLLFGGLFAAYAVFRHNHPDIFTWGSRFLDVRYGGLNTVILITSSLTMAMAVTAAQMGRRAPLVILLSLTFLGGAGFMGVKYIEYKAKFEHGLLPGTRFYEPLPHAPADEAQHEDEASHQASAGANTATPAGPADTAASQEEGFQTPRSAIAPPGQGPPGLATQDAAAAVHEHAEAGEAHRYVDHRTDPDRPANAHIFFGIYFCMTGLHGLHVLAGMTVIGWLTVRAARGHFSAAYFTPVDLGGLYWHVVDIIWIFLFPLLYLIH